MKKILFLFMMFMGLTSSLYASPPNIGNTFNINAGQENVTARTNGKNVVVAHADKKVIISHKDTLMYSWGDTGEDKMKIARLVNEEGDFYSQPIAATIATVAVVCLEFDG